MPKRIFVVAELPRNAMGKVQKAELRKRYAGTFTGSAQTTSTGCIIIRMLFCRKSSASLSR